MRAGWNLKHCWNTQVEKAGLKSFETFASRIPNRQTVHHENTDSQKELKILIEW
jgi:hypothetical protein